MKYVKILGLLAVAASALMAFAGSASATTITSPTNTLYTKDIHATSEGHATLKTFVNIQCHSTVSGTTLTHGDGVTAKGAIANLLWGTSGKLDGTCTNGWHVTTVFPGSLEIHWIAEHEGTLTSTGATVHATRFGVDCYYATNSTHIGTLTDSHRTGSTAAPQTATLHVKANIPIEATSDALCGTGNAEWEGSYRIETPDNIFINK